MNRQTRYTALMLAAELGHVNVVKLLVDAGADQNAQNEVSER